jgi:hypothetical protein
MIRKLLICMLLLPFSTLLFSQTLSLKSNTLSLPEKSTGQCIIKTSLNQYYLYCGPGIVCLDSIGDLQWYKRYLTTGYSGGKIMEASNGDIFMMVQSTAVGPGNGDVMIFRMDSVGNIHWIKVFGTANTEVPVDIAEKKNGDILIAAYANGFTTGQNEMILFSINALGDQLWERGYFFDSIPCISSGMALGNNDDIYLTGNTDENGFLLKTDSNGLLKWSLEFPLCKINDVEVDTSTNKIFLCGYHKSLAYPDLQGAFFAVHDGDGNTSWHRAISSGSDADTSEAFFIHYDYSSHKILTGGQQHNIDAGSEDFQAFSYLFDMSGNEISTVAFGGSMTESFFDAIPAGNSQIIWSGYTESFGNGNNISLNFSDSLARPACYWDYSSCVFDTSKVACFDPGFINDTGNLDVVSYCFPPNHESCEIQDQCLNIIQETAIHSLNAEVCPNPNFGSFELRVSGISGKVKMRLTDIQGREILNRSALVNKEVKLTFYIDENIPAGIYNLQLNSEQGVKTIQVLILSK